MKMKPTSKDFYMEIRKSPGRFLSILFIVALGVAFFSGIRASEPDMRLTGDTYFDESNLMDIKALSTYGVTQDDVDAILKLLQDTCREKGMTVILITHNSAIAPMADRVIKIKNGMVSEMTVNEHPVPVETIEW